MGNGSRRRAATRGRARSWGWLLAASLAGLPEAAASPWNRDAGAGLLINKVSYYEAEAEGRRFEQVTSELYAERGLTPRVMVGGKLGYAWQSVDQPAYQDALSGVSEAEGFVQYEVARGAWGAAGLMVVGSAPASTTSRVLDGVSFDRDASAGVSALLGRDLGPGFLSVSAGPRLSLGKDADVLRGEATIGSALGERGLLMVEGFATQSLGGAEPGGVDFDLYQVAPSIVLPLWRFRLQLGATVDVAGSGVDLGTGGFVALWSGR